MSPEAFTGQVRDFMATASHPTLDRPLRGCVYQPMLELIDELRRRATSLIAIVTGGGTEFVRAVSQDLYGVPPEAVVGTLIEYDVLAAARTERRACSGSARVDGAANEGAAKVSNIQTQLGRRPILAAGNSGGDREMLEWAARRRRPDPGTPRRPRRRRARVQLRQHAETFSEAEPITDVGRRLGWTVVSMANDWDPVFPANDN